VRGALVALSVLGAAAAVVLGARHTWPELGRARFHLTAVQAERAAPVREGLPFVLFERWRAELRPGERWWLDIPPGASEGLTNRGGVYRAYAVFFFLPALPARTEAAAEVVFRLGAAP
jgi:hypothetical protein